MNFIFSRYIAPDEKSGFDKLFKVFIQLITYTSGDVREALDWLNDIDAQYNLSNDEYGIQDFLEDLKAKGYLEEGKNDGNLNLTGKTEQTIRKQALDEIFGKLRKTSPGDHQTNLAGNGDEISPDRKSFEFGDSLDSLDITGSIHRAHINHGIDEFKLTQEDLEVYEREHKSQQSTVLMIDISHSMILYGEDRITPAKKVAMGLAELIRIKYPKDTLDIIVFGNDAWPIELKDLPYLQVGPYHTNTTAGLELAVDILRKRKTPNKQILMITDGKPTCLKEGNQYYKNSFGLDRKVVARTLNMAAQCRRLKIPITTFMIASDPYLQQFVKEFTEVNKGKAFYSNLDGLGNFVFEDFEKNRKKRGSR